MPIHPWKHAPASLIAAALALAPVDAEAGGDVMWGTRGDERMVEREHQIALTFERGYATMVVRRTVHNGIDRHDEAVYELMVPTGGVAIGLRTLGERRGKPHWYAADLLETGEAQARYRELTGFEPHQPEVKDPALLAWSSTGGLILQVFPVAPRTDKTVEYTIDMPAYWADGQWNLGLEAIGLDDQPAELIVQPKVSGDFLYVDDEPIGAGHRLVLDAPHILSLVPRERPLIELELASIDTGNQRALSFWRVTAAPELSQVPERARVVVALDLSRSLSDEEVEAQRHAALAYLEHFSGSELEAEVAVFGFDHAIRPLTSGFVSAAQAKGALRGASLELGNGSAVDLALSEAERLFASGSAKAPRRVLLLTDFATASSRSIGEYEALASKTKATVHLAAVTPGDVPELARDDAHLWAGVAARTEGVVWHAVASAAEDFVEQRVDVFTEWARPIRIDMPRIDAGDPDGWWPSLDEGQGEEQLFLSDAQLERIRFSGLLWNRRIEQQTKRSRSLSKRWAALVFGEWMWGDWSTGGLEREEMLRLAFLGGAVSPVTSYLAVEPGVRPSSEGIDRKRNTGLIGKGGCGGRASGYGHGSGVAFGGRLDRQAWLDEQLNAAWQRCGGTTLATLELETTYEEIVDFVLTGAGDPAQTTCMHARTWALRLPASDFFEDRARWTVELAPS